MFCVDQVEFVFGNYPILEFVITPKYVVQSLYTAGNRSWHIVLHVAVSVIVGMVYVYRWLTITLVVEHTGVVSVSLCLRER